MCASGGTLRVGAHQDTGTGTVTLDGGTGYFRHFHARAVVSFIAGDNWDGTRNASDHFRVTRSSVSGLPPPGRFGSRANTRPSVVSEGGR
jgi:hypothetical protein